jgi:hypothetical protein
VTDIVVQRVAVTPVSHWRWAVPLPTCSPRLPKEERTRPAWTPWTAHASATSELRLSIILFSDEWNNLAGGKCSKGYVMTGLAVLGDLPVRSPLPQERAELKQV